MVSLGFTTRFDCDFRLYVSAFYFLMNPLPGNGRVLERNQELDTIEPASISVSGSEFYPEGSCQTVGLPSANVTVVQLVLLGCDLYDHRGSSGLSSPP